MDEVVRCAAVVNVKQRSGRQTAAIYDPRALWDMNFAFENVAVSSIDSFSLWWGAVIVTEDASQHNKAPLKRRGFAALRNYGCFDFNFSANFCSRCWKPWSPAMRVSSTCKNAMPWVVEFGSVNNRHLSWALSRIATICLWWSW